jgi:glycosyltransferase involved in cell wall biosynthesis
LRTVHALIVGESLYGEKNYVAALKRRIEDYGLADRVHFLGFRTDVPLLMHAVDVVVHTSTAPEPFGRVIVEGMLSGRPVIATAGGGPEEIIQNGLSGIIIPPEDSRSLAAAIRSLLEATPRRERMVSIAKDRAHEFFSLTSMLSRTDEVICRVGRSS